jgi:hypothetical protein
VGGSWTMKVEVEACDGGSWRDGGGGEKGLGVPCATGSPSRSSPPPPHPPTHPWHIPGQAPRSAYCGGVVDAAT